MQASIAGAKKKAKLASESPAAVTAIAAAVDTDYQRQPRLILTSPYQLSGRSAMFRSRYTDQIGFTALSQQSTSIIAGMNSPVISRSMECLGFKRLDETAVAETISASGQKLSVLITHIGNNHPALTGSNILTIKPYVNRMYQVCSKWQLVHSLRQAEKRMRQRGQSFITGSGSIFSHEVFTPLTVNLGSGNLEEILTKHPGTFLAKPVGRGATNFRGSMGDQIQLVHIRGDRVRKDLLSFLTGSEYLKMSSSHVILQRYIERPLLVDKRKFDLRVYMMVVNAKRVVGASDCNDPGDDPNTGYFVFMHPGFVRLCTAPYDPSNTDLAVHLTNQSIQAKMTKTFAQLKEVTTWYPDELNDYLNKRQRAAEPNWTKNILYPKIGAQLGYISTVFRYFLDDRDCSSNTFRILGVDFLIDEQLRIYLLEFNAYPAWGCQTSVLSDMKPNLWREAVCLSSEVAIRFRTRQPITEQLLVTRQNFSMVFNSEDPDLARGNIANMY